MRRVLLLFPLMSLLFAAACATGGSGGPTPTTPPFTSEVTLTRPQPGTVVYAESLSISGIVNGDDAQTLLIDLLVAGELLTQATIDADPGVWSLELPHTYSGEPAVLELVVSPAGDAEGEYARIPLTVADIVHRPDGAFATIFLPQSGDTVGGDAIPVEGTASGMDTLRVLLLADDDTILNEQSVALVNPFLVDEVPWQVELEPGDYTGAARIELRYPADVQATPVAVEITLDLSAG